jgi:hypothetical protein
LTDGRCRPIYRSETRDGTDREADVQTIVLALAVFGFVAVKILWISTMS